MKQTRTALLALLLVAVSAAAASAIGSRLSADEARRMSPEEIRKLEPGYPLDTSGSRDSTNTMSDLDAFGINIAQGHIAPEDLPEVQRLLDGGIVPVLRGRPDGKLELPGSEDGEP